MVLSENRNLSGARSQYYPCYYYHFYYHQLLLSWIWLLSENVESLWGPIPLPRLPPGVDNTCRAVTHGSVLSLLQQYSQKISFKLWWSMGGQYLQSCDTRVSSFTSSAIFANKNLNFNGVWVDNTRRAVTHGEYLLSLTIWTKIQTLITPGVDNTCRAVTHSHGSVLTLFYQFLQQKNIQTLMKFRWTTPTQLWPIGNLLNPSFANIWTFGFDTLWFTP